MHLFFLKKYQTKRTKGTQEKKQNGVKNGKSRG